MGERYDEIAQLDKPLADRWRARTKEDAKYRLTEKDFDFIIGPTLEKPITEKQGAAIFQIMMASEKTDKEFKSSLLCYPERPRNGG